MAVISKKDKLVDEAQKFALRGQFDKAAKVYEQLVALEPAAINQRQKLAELLIRCNRTDDARKELEAVGAHFSKNGFYLKAIAVYKQLQKLFPADISLSLTLAELNEKHGLVANSLSEYKLVYEFHEKAGNIPEALGILEKMQNVDPQNLPIKIKLAEALFQQGKKDDSAKLFSQTVSLLLERDDKATLAKVSARFQQLFPDKPDFMLDILAGQISQGNASSAVDTLQGILRGNPHNKRVWDLIAQAYSILDQPQRVKIAFQHYLKFFPAEPAAMYGLIAAVAAENNLADAIDLLDHYESALLSAGYFSQLEKVYLALDAIDPINIRVLEGLIRVATASGNEKEVISLSSKLKSLYSITASTANTAVEVEAPPALLEEQRDEESSVVHLESEEESFFDVNIAEQLLPEYEETPETPQTTEPFTDAEPLGSVFDAVQPPDEEIEIDIAIDFDADSPFADSDQESGTVSGDGNWLDSIDDLFDTINTTPSGVKFGNEMENSDAQSHFDLGQAFKEMGLFHEAINEFRQAALDPARRIECLIMQCACLRERGEVEKAISILLTLLKPGLRNEESCAVKYELATGYEAVGNYEDATRILNEIHAENPDFRDISSRLNAANNSESLIFSDEDLDDFGLK